MSSITRSLRLLRKLDPIEPVASAIAGALFLSRYASVKGSHNGERG